MRENLVKRMEQLNLSRIELAKKLNVNRSTVTSWVNGRRTPRVDEMDKLYSALGLVFDPYKLLEDDKKCCESSPIDIMKK